MLETILNLKGIAYLSSSAIEILVPLIITIIIWKKFKVSWAVFFLGIVLFLVALIKTPLNNYLGTILAEWFSGELFYLLYGAVAGLTVAIIEEGARTLAIGAIIRPRDYFKGLMYGTGFGGGGESMIFTGLLTIASFILYGYFPDILPVNMLTELNTQIWYLPFKGAFDGVMGISMQIALSVLIMHAFLYRKYYIIPLTIISRWIIEFSKYYINYKLGFWFTELAVFIIAVIGLVIILSLRPKNKGKT